MTLHRLIIGCLLISTPVFCQVSPQHEIAPHHVIAEDHISGRIVAQKTRLADSAAITRSLETQGVKVLKYMPQLGVYVLSVPEASAPRIMRVLDQTGLFTYVEQDGAGRSRAIPNDPDFGSQWHLGAINAVAAWNISTGSNSVPIAIIDSGVDQTHPDLASRLIPGWNFLLNNNNTADDLGHGTATAGTAGAATNDGMGVAGVGWLNPIMPLVVVDSTGYAAYSDIASAIMYAADNGVRVMNISIAGSGASSTLQSAVTYAWNKGAIVVAAAGNNSSSTPMYPAACQYAIAVSATEPGDTLASFSNYGSWIDLSAPGDNIFTTTEGGSYGTWYGTSFSSPITAAAAALVLSINPSLTAQSVVTLLENNSDQVGGPGFSNSFGWGRIDLYKAAVAAEASISVDTTPPTVSIAAPRNGAVVSGSVQITGKASDNVGVVNVQLWVDGSLNSTCTVAFACTWNASAELAGIHTVVVKAFDAAGNMGSATETLAIAATAPVITTSTSTTPPVVQITNPATGATVTGNLSIQVTATDHVGVTQVSIYVDSVLKSTLTKAPYSYQWNTKKEATGSHTINAKAWDAAGNTASATIPVVVK